MHCRFGKTNFSYYANITIMAQFILIWDYTLLIWSGPGNSCRQPHQNIMSQRYSWRCNLFDVWPHDTDTLGPNSAFYCLMITQNRILNYIKKKFVNYCGILRTVLRTFLNKQILFDTWKLLTHVQQYSVVTN